MRAENGTTLIHLHDKYCNEKEKYRSYKYLATDLKVSYILYNIMRVNLSFLKLSPLTKN